MEIDFRMTGFADARHRKKSLVPVSSSTRSSAQCQQIQWSKNASGGTNGPRQTQVHLINRDSGQGFDLEKVMEG